MFGFSSAAWADTIARSPQRTVRRMCYAGAETAAQKKRSGEELGSFHFHSCVAPLVNHFQKAARRWMTQNIATLPMA